MSFVSLKTNLKVYCKISNLNKDFYMNTKYTLFIRDLKIEENEVYNSKLYLFRFKKQILLQ